MPPHLPAHQPSCAGFHVPHAHQGTWAFALARASSDTPEGLPPVCSLKRRHRQKKPDLTSHVVIAMLRQQNAPLQLTTHNTNEGLGWGPGPVCCK